MNLLIEGLAGGFRSIVNIAVICVPIMVALQLAKGRDFFVGRQSHRALLGRKAFLGRRKGKRQRQEQKGEEERYAVLRHAQFPMLTAPWQQLRLRNI